MRKEKGLWKEIRWNAEGLLPAVIQDDASGRVLTLNYMNPEAVRRTLEEGVVWVFRRTAGRLMKKGETSGHVQTVKSVYLDCEGKSLVIQVDQKVAACHRGFFSCYFRQTERDGRLKPVREKKVFDPGRIYGKGS